MKTVKRTKTKKPTAKKPPNEKALIENMAKAFAELPPFNFTPRTGGEGKLYIHSQKWRKGYEERQAANQRRKERFKKR